MSNSLHRLYDHSDMPVAAMAVDYPHGHFTDRHQHPHAQLIYAAQGVMLVATDAGQWIVPPTRGLWVPAGVDHWIRMIGEVHIRTAYVRNDATPGLPQECRVLAISPLLRELLIAAVAIKPPYTPDSRAGHLVQLLLDEIRTEPTLALHLPTPADARIRRITERLHQHPDDPSTVADWATHLHIDPKTVQRLFAKETGMSFGQWRQQARLLAGLERLAQGEKILNVALELGYSSPSAFSTMFRKQFGVPPSEFFG